MGDPCAMRKGSLSLGNHIIHVIQKVSVELPSSGPDWLATQANITALPTFYVLCPICYYFVNLIRSKHRKLRSVDETLYLTINCLNTLLHNVVISPY